MKGRTGKGKRTAREAGKEERERRGETRGVISLQI
jgi:hypothetical protein